MQKYGAVKICGPGQRETQLAALTKSGSLLQYGALGAEGDPRFEAVDFVEDGSKVDDRDVLGEGTFAVDTQFWPLSQLK